MSKVNCVCSEGVHNLTVTQLVQVVYAFQRGELQRFTTKGIASDCVMDALKTDEETSVVCGALLQDGYHCIQPKRHTKERHM